MIKINERIKGKFSELSNSQKKVAYYILENIEEAALNSAQKIAESSQVSEATVHRLAQALGFESFMEMKQEIQQFIRNDQRAVNNLISATTLPQDSWLEQHFLQEAENIIYTSQGIAKKEINLAAGKLIYANYIWIGGWRMSLAVTSFMQFALKYMLGNCLLIPQGEAAEYTAYFKKEDVIFVCAFPRYDYRLIKIAEMAKEKGAYVIALTDSSLSPICKTADLSLFAKKKSKSFLDSYTAAVSICNAIINEISYIGGERVKSNIENMEIYFSAFNEKK
ncbi:MurR/RpiR family transcriptional regulator [Bacillaceae bacterium Marseille-Q3522]|nr:MurR/RpiR family transcriptional regulator [Bacillaceae bacterium Marseille-Q3522]